jgi:hypothetical protein
MKTNSFLLACAIGMCLYAQTSYGQATYATNDPTTNPIPLGSIGWNDITNTDLNFGQNNTRRLRMTSVSWPGYNGSAATLNASRMFFGIDGNNMTTPFSMMHLGYNISANLRRNWMNVGTTYGAGADIMHVGLLNRPAIANNNAQVDAVIAWGCNDQFFSPVNGPDNLRFLFLAPTTATASPGSAQEGLETMRITPWGNVGIGSVFNNNQQPVRRLVVAQRTDSVQFRVAWDINQNPVLGDHADFQVTPLSNLHIRPSHNNNKRTTVIGFLRNEQPDPYNAPLDSIITTLDIGGLTRIRELPDSVPNSLIVGFNIPEANQGDNDRFIGKLDFPNDSTMYLDGTGNWSNNLSDCRWADTPSLTVTGETDIYTGFDPEDPCHRGKVAIGSNAPKAKLDVTMRTERDNTTAAISADATDSEPGFGGGPTLVYGVLSNAEGINEANTYIGVAGQAQEGKYAVGLLGLASSIAGVNISIGTYTKATASASANIGIYAEAPAGSTDYAAQLIGGITFTQPPIMLSDQTIKTDINPINNATQLLSLFQPKTYYNINETGRNLGLEDGLQYGFMAQQINEVAPQLVRTVVLPPVMDETGFVSGTEIELLGIQYTEIVPILVAGFQEQNTIIAAQAGIIENQETQLNSQAETIAELESKVENMEQKMESMFTIMQSMQAKTNNCCKDENTGSMNTPASTTEGVKLMQNVPNPFDTTTRIDFILPADANVVLELSDVNGRPLRRLIDGQMNAGPQSVILDGSSLASGMYYYTVYANGELLTKKMVKK